MIVPALAWRYYTQQARQAVPPIREKYKLCCREVLPLSALVKTRNTMEFLNKLVEMFWEYIAGSVYDYCYEHMEAVYLNSKTDWLIRGVYLAKLRAWNKLFFYSQ